MGPRSQAPSVPSQRVSTASFPTSTTSYALFPVLNRTDPVLRSAVLTRCWNARPSYCRTKHAVLREWVVLSYSRTTVWLTDEIPHLRSVCWEAMERLGQTHEEEKNNNDRY
eukprot:3698755-Rhodomonas_salina.4